MNTNRTQRSEESEGFIRLNGLRLKIRSLRDQASGG